MLSDVLTESIKKKNKSGTQIKPHQIKNHLWVFVNCLINNPTFDGQTKETMTLQANAFGSKCVMTDKKTSPLSPLHDDKSDDDGDKKFFLDEIVV